MRHLRLGRGFAAHAGRGVRAQARARRRGRPRRLSRLHARRVPGHAALDQCLAERAALGDDPAHETPAPGRTHLLPALVQPVPLLQRSLHARPALGRPARARRRPRCLADRIDDLRFEEHRRVARPLPRDTRHFPCCLPQRFPRLPGPGRGALQQAVQKPYPPLWFPSSNRDSIEFTAKHGYHTALLARLADCKPLFERYREIWEQHRNDPGRHNAHVAAPFLARTLHMVIAETEAEAERLGLEAHRKWSGHIHHLTRKLGRPDVHNTEPYAAESLHPLVTGTPRTALDKISEVLQKTGANYLLGVFSFGDLAPQHAMRSLELFGSEVMPKLKA